MTDLARFRLSNLGHYWAQARQTEHAVQVGQAEWVEQSAERRIYAHCLLQVAWQNVLVNMSAENFK